MVLVRIHKTETINARGKLTLCYVFIWSVFAFFKVFQIIQQKPFDTILSLDTQDNCCYTIFYIHLQKIYVKEII